MYRKWIYAPIVAIAALGLIATMGFASNMSSKKADSAQEYMGKGVGAMQGKERPPQAVPEPATSAEPSQRAVRQELSEEAKGGVGAMQGKERPPQAVPEPATQSPR
jgi:hypothetical protein